jgi:hypothetical protein
VRRLCLALPEVTEGLTHGGETWFVRRRSFAKFVDPEKHRLDERHVAFWAAAPPGARNELVAEDPQRFCSRDSAGTTGWGCGSIYSPTDPTGRRSAKSSRMPIGRLRRSSSPRGWSRTANCPPH